MFRQGPSLAQVQAVWGTGEQVRDTVIHHGQWIGCVALIRIGRPSRQADHVAPLLRGDAPTYWLQAHEGYRHRSGMLCDITMCNLSRQQLPWMQSTASRCTAVTQTTIPIRLNSPASSQQYRGQRFSMNGFGPSGPPVLQQAVKRRLAYAQCVGRDPFQSSRCQ